VIKRELKNCFTDVRIACTETRNGDQEPYFNSV